MKAITQILLGGFLLLSSTISIAKGVSIDDPYVREVPPGQMISASFMTLKNDTDKEVALIKATSDVAKTVELHEHVHVDGMMKMRPVPKIAIPANGVTPLKPGGYHIMLIGLQRKIKAGDKIDINLEFDNGEKETITATVKKVMMGMKGGMKGMKMGDMAKMKAAKEKQHHLNPMPNLMMVFKKMPEKLNLSAEQTSKLKEGVKERNPKVKKTFEMVSNLEAELHTAILEGKSLTDIDQLANSLMQERQNIINGKAACAESVKQIIDEKQFKTMQEIYKTKMAYKASYSDDEQGKMKMIKHVNPVPNLMIVVKKMSDKLNLTEQQAADLKQWQDERGPIMQKQYAAVLKAEADLQDAALSNAPPEKIAELSDTIMQERIKIIRSKAFCRDNMQRILDNEQFEKVIELYKANFL